MRVVTGACVVGVVKSLIYIPTTASDGYLSRVYYSTSIARCSVSSVNSTGKVKLL